MRNDMTFPNREAMINDLLTSHSQVGRTLAEVRDLLGTPEYHEPHQVGYQLTVDFGMNIDPVHSRSLMLTFDHDSVVTKQEVKEWHKED